MPSFTIGEILLVALLAFFILGPDKMPEYAAKLAQWIRKMRVMAEGAKTQLKDQLGPDYQDINWRQYDPRQYDPRRIVREALLEPLEEATAPVRSALSGEDLAASPAPVGAGDAPVSRGPRGWDPGRPTPFDRDAT